MKKEVLHVEGMSCDHCVRAIKEALDRIYVHARVDLDLKTVSIEYDEMQVNRKQINKVIEDQGYNIV